MSSASFHILYPLKEGPWGGGNQFLYALRAELKKRAVYSDTPEAAAILLVNSHHCLPTAVSLVSKFPSLRILHRLDGVLSTQRKFGGEWDKLIHFFSENFSDGVVFQSKWAQKALDSRGLRFTRPSRVIVNAPDPEIFKHHQTRQKNGKIRVFVSSWSSNKKKGFEIYRYLDENLDWNLFEVTFVGNSPVLFKNFRQLAPLSKEGIAKELKEHDLFLTASADDACSNAVLEALHTEIPVVALDSGGHPEIVGSRGLLFQGAEELPALLLSAYERRDEILSGPRPKSLSNIVDEYVAFGNALLHNPPKYRSRIEAALFRLKHLEIRTKHKIRYHLRMES